MIIVFIISGVTAEDTRLPWSSCVSESE